MAVTACSQGFLETKYFKFTVGDLRFKGKVTSGNLSPNFTAAGQPEEEYRRWSSLYDGLVRFCLRVT